MDSCWFSQWKHLLQVVAPSIVTQVTIFWDDRTAGRNPPWNNQSLLSFTVLRAGLDSQFSEPIAAPVVKDSRRDDRRIHDETIQHKISKGGWWIELTNTKPHRVERMCAHPYIPRTTVRVYWGPCSFSENLSTPFSQKKITHFCCLLLDNIRSSTETLQWKSTKKLCWRHLPTPYDIMNSEVVLM